MNNKLLVGNVLNKYLKYFQKHLRNTLILKYSQTRYNKFI